MTEDIIMTRSQFKALRVEGEIRESSVTTYGAKTVDGLRIQIVDDDVPAEVEAYCPTEPRNRKERRHRRDY